MRSSSAGFTTIDILIGIVLAVIAAGIGIYSARDVIWGSQDTIMREQAVKFQESCNMWLSSQKSVAAAAKAFQVSSGTTTVPKDPAALLAAVLPYLSTESARTLQVNDGKFSSEIMRKNNAYMTVTWSTDLHQEMAVQVYIPDPS